MLSKKIKIIHITTDSKIGGTEKMLITFAKNYDRKKYEFIFITLLGNGPLIKELENLDCKVYFLNMKNKLDVFKFFYLYK